MVVAVVAEMALVAVVVVMEITMVAVAAMVVEVVVGNRCGNCNGSGCDLLSLRYFNRFAHSTGPGIVEQR